MAYRRQQKNRAEVHNWSVECWQKCAEKEIPLLCLHQTQMKCGGQVRSEIPLLLLLLLLLLYVCPSSLYWHCVIAAYVSDNKFILILLFSYLESHSCCSLSCTVFSSCQRGAFENCDDSWQVGHKFKVSRNSLTFNFLKSTYRVGQIKRGQLSFLSSNIWINL